MARVESTSVSVDDDANQAVVESTGTSVCRWMWLGCWNRNIFEEAYVSLFGMDGLALTVSSRIIHGQSMDSGDSVSFRECVRQRVFSGSCITAVTALICVAGDPEV